MSIFTKSVFLLEEYMVSVYNVYTFKHLEYSGNYIVKDVWYELGGV